MKKAFVMTMAVLMAVSFISCGTKGDTGAAGPTGPTGNPGTNFGDIPSNATILINENFDGMAIGTTPTTNAQPWRRAENWNNNTTSMYHHVTDTAFVTYDKGLKLVTAAIGLDRQIVKAPFLTSIPSTTSGKVYISFYVNKAENTKGKGFVFYLNQIEKMRIDFNETGNITYSTAINTRHSIGTYNANEWYKVNAIVNLSTNTYNVYVRDYIIENVPCYNVQEQVWDGTIIDSDWSVHTSFWGILTNINNNYSVDTTYIDNVIVYYLP